MPACGQRSYKVRPEPGADGAETEAQGDPWGWRDGQQDRVRESADGHPLFLSQTWPWRRNLQSMQNAQRRALLLRTQAGAMRRQRVGSRSPLTATAESIKRLQDIEVGFRCQGASLTRLGVCPFLGTQYFCPDLVPFWVLEGLSFTPWSQKVLPSQPPVFSVLSMVPAVYLEQCWEEEKKTVNRGQSCPHGAHSLMQRRQVVN